MSFIPSSYHCANHGVQRDGVPFRHLQEQTTRVLQAAVFAVSGQDGVPGEDVLLRYFIEQLMGRADVIAAGVELDEVVGEECVGEETHTEDSRVQNLACEESFIGDAQLQ